MKVLRLYYRLSNFEQRGVGKASSRRKFSLTIMRFKLLPQAFEETRYRRTKPQVHWDTAFQSCPVLSPPTPKMSTLNYEKFKNLKVIFYEIKNWLKGSRFFNKTVWHTMGGYRSYGSPDKNPDFLVMSPL